MQFIIISGLSGAGQSKAASDLEDLGFYCCLLYTSRCV